MLLTAIKLKVAALAVVAGIETTDLKNQSPEVKALVDGLETAQTDFEKNAQTKPEAVGEFSKKVNDAFAAAKKLADEKNDPNASYLVAHWAAGLQNVNVNDLVTYYKKAGDIPAAQIELAQVYLQAFKQDAERAKEAIDLILKAQAAGNKLARRTVAQLHLNGTVSAVIPQDAKKAIELFEAGSKDGDGESSLALYQIHTAGINGVVQQDHKKALEKLQEATKQGSATALGVYGARLLNGDPDTADSPKLVNKDVKAAVAQFESAGSKGLAAAHTLLGQLYERGMDPDIKPDAEAAFKNYQQAAARNDATALLRLAQAFETGIAKTGTKPDDKGQWDPKDILIAPNPKNSLDAYRLAAQARSAEAYYAVGRFYETGTVVDADPTKAFQLYLAAANAGVLPAMNQLAGLYANGTGITQDIIAAAGWFKRAADAGYTESKIIYGDLNARGAGMPLNLIAAQSYYEEAAQQGSILALIRLAMLHGQSGVAATPSEAKPNLPLAWAFVQLASEAAKGSSAEVTQFVAAFEAAKDKDGKDAITDKVKEDGKKELAKLKDTFKVFAQTATPAPAAAAAPAADAKKGDAKKKSGTK